MWHTPLKRLILRCSSWNAELPSSYNDRVVVQKHLNAFTLPMQDGLTAYRALSSIKITGPETEPLTVRVCAGLEKAHAAGKANILIELMRWSGLAIRDASTLRKDVQCEKGLYKIQRDRAKTGTPLYIPIPPKIAKEVLAISRKPVYVFMNKQTATSSEYRQAGYMGEAIAKVFEAAGVQSEGHDFRTGCDLRLR